jgi:hypothetical protein
MLYVKGCGSTLIALEARTRGKKWRTVFSVESQLDSLENPTRTASNSMSKEVGDSFFGG